jgi:hypothetical protein
MWAIRKPKNVLCNFKTDLPRHGHDILSEQYDEILERERRKLMGLPEDYDDGYLKVVLMTHNDNH